jgi:tetratricopeptide (TPR) repeat protein
MYGDTDSAVDEYRRGGELGDEDAPRHIARVLVNAGRIPAAIEELKAAIASGDRKARHDLATLYSRWRGSDLAIRELESALAVGDPDARRRLANELTKTGRYSEAAEHHRVLVAEGSPGALKAAARFFHRFTDNGDEAVRLLKSAPRDDAGAILQLARCTIQLEGDLKQGIAILRTAIADGHTWAHSELGALLVTWKRPDEAIAEYRAAVELGDRDSIPRLAHLLEGTSPDEAAEVWSRGIDLGLQGARIGWANMLARQGAHGASIRQLKAGVASCDPAARRTILKMYENDHEMVKKLIRHGASSL